MRIRIRGANARRIERFDDVVDGAFERLRGHRPVDRLFYGASAVGDHGMLWVMLGALRGLRGDHHWRAAVRVAVGVGVESVVVNAGVKSLFRRTRPVVIEPRPFPLRIPLTSSFPSGHATSAFCAATLLSDGDPHLAPLYYGAATVVALSRIHVKIHHASDVAGGILVGLILGRIGKRIAPLDTSPARPPE
ncbi:MAG TPA: phosphatase PAP2 family protein [Acidimicrobiales bacterium]|jgi:undecaprenyl-diphosphatase